MSYPPYSFPSGPPPGPFGVPRTRHPWRAPLIALGVVVVLVVAVVLAIVVSSRVVVSSADDVSVGDCVRVTETGSGTVKPRKYDCNGSKFSFYVAARSAQGRTLCIAGNYSRISFDGGGELCLAPNWRQGHCYEVPRSSDPGATYAEKACSTVPASRDRPIYEITHRFDGTTDPRCDDPDMSVAFALPKPVGYCYTLASDMPA